MKSVNMSLFNKWIKKIQYNLPKWFFWPIIYKFNAIFIDLKKFTQFNSQLRPQSNVLFFSCLCFVNFHFLFPLNTLPLYFSKSIERIRFCFFFYSFVELKMEENSRINGNSDSEFPEFFSSCRGRLLSVYAHVTDCVDWNNEYLSEK